MYITIVDGNADKINIIRFEKTIDEYREELIENGTINEEDADRFRVERKIGKSIYEVMDSIYDKETKEVAVYVSDVMPDIHLSDSRKMVSDTTDYSHIDYSWFDQFLTKEQRRVAELLRKEQSNTILITANEINKDNHPNL